MKVCLVGSSGGHLAHLNMLKPFWSEQDRFWVTFDKEDARSILKDEQFYPCYFPTNRNFKNLVKNTFLALKILLVKAKFFTQRQNSAADKWQFFCFLTMQTA